MIHKNSQIDVNDLGYAMERHGFLMDAEPCPLDKRTGKINPHVSRFSLLGHPEKKVSVFHVKPVYYETPEGAWRPLYEVTTYHGNKNVVFDYSKLAKVHPRYIEWLSKRCTILGGAVSVTSPFSEESLSYNFAVSSLHRLVTKPTVGLTTTTVYPDPDPESTTVDGVLYLNGPANSFANLHNTANATGTAPSSATQWSAILGANSSGSTWYYLYRAGFLFDTSAIPDTDTIDSGTLSISANSGTNTGSMSLSFGFVDFSPATNTDLVSADFNNTSFVRQVTDIAYGSISTTTYTDWTLNTTGKGNVSKTGVTKFLQCTANDIDNSAPTWVANALCGFDIDYADQTGTSQDPKLAVVHTGGAVTVSATVVTSTFSIPAYSVIGKAVISPSTQSSVFSIPTYAVKVGCTVSPSAQTATFSIPTYDVIIASTTATPNVAGLTFSIPVYDVKTYALVMPNGQTLTFSIPAYTIAVEASIIVTPDTLVLSFTLPSRVKIGAVWEKTGRGTSATWSRSTRNVGDWTKSTRNSN